MIVDEHKICIIMCVNNKQYMDEAIYYINKLEIPENFEIELYTVADAKSMTSGYNEAMRMSNAKYKIYMHQDVFIVNKHYIYDILHVFEDKTIGMIGMAGAIKFPDNAIWWKADQAAGSFITNDIIKTTQVIMPNYQNIYDVKCVDGFLIATQYDLSWREDVFDGWDFYDVSQSFEFRKAGYRVVVPYMKKPWAMHYDKILNLKNYYKYRKVFLDNYEF